MALRRWTEEEDLFLEENVGKMKLATIAKKINRSVNAVEIRLYRLGLGNTRLLSGSLTANELARIIKVDRKTIDRWIKNHGLKATKKVTRLRAKFVLIRPEDFWKWARRNKKKIDFSRIEPHALPPEPDWVEEERKKDMEKQKYKHRKWTKEDEEKAKQLFSNGTSYEEIGRILGRSKSAVEHRMSKLFKTNKAGIKKRKIHVRWTDEEINLLLQLEQRGLMDRDIAYELGREREHIADIRRRLRKKGLYKGRKIINRNIARVSD